MLRLDGAQIFGGAGFVRGVVGRICSAVKVNAIGAGTEEIMKDLVAVRWGSE